MNYIQSYGLNYANLVLGWINRMYNMVFSYTI